MTTLSELAKQIAAINPSAHSHADRETEISTLVFAFERLRDNVSQAISIIADEHP